MDGISLESYIHKEDNDKLYISNLVLDSLEVDLIVGRLLATPRTRKLLEYVLNEIEKILPGAIIFIKENFELFNTVEILMNNSMYENYHDIEILFEKIRIPECDLPNEEIQMNEYLSQRRLRR